MNIFGIGLPEIAVIAALALIIFGPKKLPELGRTLGKTLKGFQVASNEFEKEIQKAMSEPAEGMAASNEPTDSIPKDQSNQQVNEMKSSDQ